MGCNVQWGTVKHSTWKEYVLSPNEVLVGVYGLITDGCVKNFGFITAIYEVDDTNRYSQTKLKYYS